MAVTHFKKLDPNAKLPTYGTNRASGMDLYALEDFELHPDVVTVIRTGVAVQLPSGYEGQVRPRSGNAAKHGFTVLNSPGTIDNDYTGELMVIAVKLAKGSDGKTWPHQGKAGDRVAQLVIGPVEYHEIVEVSEFEETEPNERGTKGLGSSGQ